MASKYNYDAQRAQDVAIKPIVYPNQDPVTEDPLRLPPWVHGLPIAQEISEPAPRTINLVLETSQAQHSFANLTVGSGFLNQFTWNINFPAVGKLMPGTVVYVREVVSVAQGGGGTSYNFTISGFEMDSYTTGGNSEVGAAFSGRGLTNLYSTTSTSVGLWGTALGNWVLPPAATVKDLNLFRGGTVKFTRCTFGGLAPSNTFTMQPNYQRVTLVFAEPGSKYLG